MKKSLVYLLTFVLLVGLLSCKGNQRETRESTLSHAEYGKLLNPVRLSKSEVAKQITGTWELRGMILDNRICQWWVGGQPNGVATFNADGTYHSARYDGKDEESGRWLLDNFQDGDVIMFNGKKQLVTFRADTMYMRELKDGFFVLYVRCKE